MENITVIIPIHQYDEEIKNYLIRAIDSVTSQKNLSSNILIVGPENVINELNDIKNDDSISLLVNNGKTDYCNQINLAVSEVKTKYFSILGFDDVYSQSWFKNVDKYIKNMPEYSIFLPIVNFVNKENNVVGTVNEIIWAMSFSNEIGVIDADTLQSYYDFSLNGGVIRTDDFIEVGGLKPSIQLSFWYEFLLRATNQDLKIFVIPKNGYYQIIDRENSILADTNKNMDEAQRAWWIKLANKEYYFKQERKKSYTYKPEKEITDIEGLG